MLARSQKQHGVTLVEMIIALVVGSILMAVAIPSFTTWIGNTRIRGAAEGLLGALQQARSEAARRNTPVRFQLTDNTSAACALSTSGAHWVISREDPSGKCDVGISETVSPMIIQQSGAGENKNITVSASQNSIVFTGLGRVTPVPAGDIAINVANPSGGACRTDGGALRCMRIIVSTTGQTRLCDPSRPNTEPQGC